MNGELAQLLELTICAKYYLKTGEVFEINQSYVGSIHFHFLPQARLIGTKKVTAGSVSDWLRELAKRVPQEIGFYGHTKSSDRNITGFSNAVKDWTLFVRYPQHCSCWLRNWQFDQDEKQWIINYTEAQAGGYPAPQFPDTTDRFLETLCAITALAEELEQPHFAKMFADAAGLLAGEITPPPRYPMLPERNQLLLAAANAAWVFGAMGSWNDSPPYIAQIKKLIVEYEKLSADLYRDLMAAIIFAVNEW